MGQHRRSTAFRREDGYRPSRPWPRSDRAADPRAGAADQRDNGYPLGQAMSTYPSPMGQRWLMHWQQREAKMPATACERRRVITGWRGREVTMLMKTRLVNDEG